MSRKHAGLGDRVFDSALCIVMVLLSFIFAYPLWNLMVLSFSSTSYAASLGLKFWPDKINLQAYITVFNKANILTAYQNTILRVIMAVGLCVPTDVLGGYFLTRQLPLKNAVLVFLMITMFFSGGLIPGYVLIRQLGLYDSRWALVLPGMASAWNMIIAKNFIATIPKSLEESAFIDGAHPLTVVFRIIMPLSMPLIAILTLWTAVGHWNAWFDAMIYIRDNKKVILQLLLRRVLIDAQPVDGTVWGPLETTREVSPETVKAAITIVSSVPILCFYPFLQKYFVKGVLIGSIKG